MKVSANGSDYQHPDPGTVNAVCVRVIDLGTQEDKAGKKKRRVMLGWEIAQLMDDQRPFLVTARFPANISSKALLGQLLEQWRGKPFTETELESFDLAKLLGAPCLLTLLKEGDYTNVKGAVKLPAGMPKLEVQGSFTHLDLENYSEAVYASLSESLRATIAKSPEYKKAIGMPVPGSQQHGGTTSTDDTSDIPF